ncbi:MAG: ECF transporter S component [Oscillospiraceae bacterium]|jgi:uncharacterized membrane protein|nr:ECF transporter S component [Oscillospiraceae bacterium]
MANQANTSKTRARILGLTQLALLTAITVILQLLSGYFKIGIFQFALVLVPIVVGGAVLGPLAGGWLGLVFSAVVLLNGDTALFWAVNIPGTVITVLAKGVGAGLAAGGVHRLLRARSPLVATILAAAAAPIANTCVFILGCYVFFVPTLTKWANGQSITSYIFLTLIGVNFFVELLSTLLLSGAIVRIVQARQHRR